MENVLRDMYHYLDNILFILLSSRTRFGFGLAILF